MSELEKNLRAILNEYYVNESVGKQINSYHIDKAVSKILDLVNIDTCAHENVSQYCQDCFRIWQRTSSGDMGWE